MVSSSRIVTIARLIFHGSLEEGDHGISRDTQQLDSFRSEARAAALSSDTFPSLRPGTKCETSNRHDTGEIVTIKHNTSSNHI